MVGTSGMVDISPSVIFETATMGPPVSAAGSRVMPTHGCLAGTFYCSAASTSSGPSSSALTSRPALQPSPRMRGRALLHAR
mmetsp:Transcript_92074/g.159791  ORF Transcript_92074/g.159791 Transcript_92074/m.159791 type:complete len:81 (-) Transcript_92074:22-264(-)